MGSGSMSGFPPLPPGFTLDAPTQNAMPPLPDGFVLDQPGGALSDILPEMANTASSHIDTIKNMYGGTADKGVLQQTLDVGKGLGSIAAIIPDTLIGAPARSVLGHGLANATHAAGTVIDPKLAAQDNPQQMYEQAKGNVDTAMMGMAPRGFSPIGVRSAVAPAKSAAELKEAAVSVYQDPAIKNTQIPASDVANLSAGIESQLVERGFRPTTGSAPGTLGEVKRLAPPAPKQPDRWTSLEAEMNNQPIPSGPAIESVSVADIRAARSAINKTAKERQFDGTPTPDAEAARSALGEIDKFLDGISPKLREANANYSAGKAADLLDYRSMKAERRAAKTGSGSNMENTMRQEVDKIGDRGLTAPEKALRDQIVEGDTMRNALRKLGKLGVSDGLSLLMHAGGAASTGGATLPIAAGGTVARKVGEFLTRAQIKQLNEMIRSRAPLSKSQPLLTASAPNPLLSLFRPQLAAPAAFQFNAAPAYADKNK